MLITLVAFLLCSNSVFSQENTLTLELNDTTFSIENRISFNISQTDYYKIISAEGEKVSPKTKDVKINDVPANLENLHTRGQTTLYLRRKSMEIEAEEKMTFFHRGQQKKLKKVIAVSMSMDKNYMRNRLAFEMMQRLGIFNLFYTYSELQINDETEGIYLVVEEPVRWAIHEQHAPLLIRRGYNHKIDKIKAGKEIPKGEQKLFKSHYDDIYKLIRKLEGEQLYNELSALIDLDMYMDWLAFNFFVRNGDYSDEIFLYIERDEKRFKIIPWDYDDIFSSAPHEGKNTNQKAEGDKFIFSSEDALDKKISEDPYLREKYHERFRLLLNNLTEETIKEVLEHVYQELYPYFSDEKIIGMVRHDVYKQANLPALRTELHSVFQNLCLSRSAILSSLP